MSHSSFSALDLAQRLVRVPSVTPRDLGCQEVLAEPLRWLGFLVHRLPFGQVENFYARLGHRGRNFCFAGHTDVVASGDAEGWSVDPFAAEIDQGRVVGRGVCDMKGAIAAMVAAVAAFLKRHPGFVGHDSLSFLITGDEEGDAEDGTVRVLEWLEARGERLDYCLVGEPTSVERLGDCFKNGRRGSINGILTFHGQQGHVAYPHLAANPIHLAMPALERLIAHRFDQGNDSFPATGMQFTGLQAGTGATNVIPGSLHAAFNIRFSPESDPASLELAIRSILDQGGCPYDLKMKLSGLPFLTREGPLLTALSSSIQQFLAVTPHSSTGGGTSDARFISRYCPQTVEFGLVGASMHKVDESVLVEDLEKLALVYDAVLERMFFR